MSCALTDRLNQQAQLQTKATEQLRANVQMLEGKIQEARNKKVRAYGFVGIIEGPNKIDSLYSALRCPGVLGLVALYYHNYMKANLCERTNLVLRRERHKDGKKKWEGTEQRHTPACVECCDFTVHQWCFRSALVRKCKGMCGHSCMHVLSP